jgi:ABC-2 type transport system ATP-binding protein
MPQFALDVRDIDKSYRVGLRGDRRPALDGLSFSLPEGKVMGLLGPNGAGKTTTLKIIMDFLTPDSGEVDIFGRDWRDPAARGRLGFLPEQPYFHYYLTPRRVLRYLGKLLYMSDSEIETRITHLLPQVGLGDEGDLALSRFSKGMLQRLGIAQALFNRPGLLVLDEPSTGLDPLGKMEVRKILQDARDQGATIILSSHQLSEVEEICDHLCIIDRGREVAQGSIPELLGRDERYEVTLERGVELPDEAARQLQVELADGGRTLAFPAAHLDEVLRLLAQQEARLLEVRPRRITLEEFFLAHVESRSEVARDAG